MDRIEYRVISRLFRNRTHLFRNVLAIVGRNNILYYIMLFRFLLVRGHPLFNMSDLGRSCHANLLPQSQLYRM